MAKIFYPDFTDFLKALNASGVKYLLVGGYAVLIHGYTRTTGDMDIWVERTRENYTSLIKAFGFFGMPVFDMTIENFLKNEDLDVFRFGRYPVAIDIMTKMSNFDFNELYQRRIEFLDEGVLVPVISLNDLISAKEAANRFKDRDDIDKLKG